MNASLVYGIAAAVASATLFGAIRLFGRRPSAAEETEADAGTPLPSLQVLTRKRVGLGRSLVIVDADGRMLLLGSTRGQWTALADLGRTRRRRAGDAGDAGDPIDAELDRALNASRIRRGRSR